MLSREDNEALTRIGPATAMGECLRRYWIPALLPEELPEPLCAPVRVSLLGERLVAFRDGAGRIGLVGEFCPHRKASLYFGRNEEEGLRCVYHGWQYDWQGHCIDMPNEPSNSGFREKIHLRSYPCQERGGVIWAYMGPPQTMEELPQLEWMMVPDSHRVVGKVLQSCNYLQAMEGGIDSSHVTFLHRDTFPRSYRGRYRRYEGELNRVFDDGAPRFFVESTDYGMLIGARRTTAEKQYYWRISQWIMPWYTLIPPDGDHDFYRGAHAWVPQDDEHTWTWSIDYNPDRPLTKTERDYLLNGVIHQSPTLPGSFLPVQNIANEYLIDRDLQASGASFTGIKGAATQDRAIQESMGPVVDRSDEHLGSTDVAVIAARKRLLSAVHALQDRNQMPPGRDPRCQRVRSAAVVLNPEESWTEATARQRQSPPHLYSAP